MPPGRPKGSKNKPKPYPEGQDPPPNWMAEIDHVAATRHALEELAGAILPENFGECTAYKAFRLLWDDDLEDEVLERTNELTDLQLDCDTLHRFLLAGLLMCVNIRRQYKLHWSQDLIFENSEVKQLISREQFEMILRGLRPSPQFLVEHANSTFQAHWKPYSHVSVDEGLMLFKGRYDHRVHIRGKPNATGLKFYGLGDEKSYLYAMKLYGGEHQTIEDIVLELLEALPSRKFKLYADSWYGSDSLAFSLTQRGFLFTLACGKNKPSELFNNYLDVGLVKGQCRYLQSEQDPALLALSYHDRAKCHFLTNLFRPAMTQNRKNNAVPSAVEDYRQYMGIIDRIDRSALLARWPHRNRRWTMAFFWYLLGLCVNNAHKIYNDVNPGYISLSQFLHQLIVQWREILKTKSGAPRRPLHQLKISPSKARCEVCRQTDRKIAKTRLVCSICHVHLHPQCFPLYHKRS